MNSSEPVGTVRALWRFPVKSMLGEELDAAESGEAGVVGDRAYALRDRETGKIASAKHPKLWPNLLGCRAAFVESPRPGDELPPARIELADGSSVLSDAGMPTRSCRASSAATWSWRGLRRTATRSISTTRTRRTTIPRDTATRLSRRSWVRRSSTSAGSLPLSRRLVLRPLPVQRPHHLNPGPAGRTRTAEPLRRPAVPHERDRRYPRAWLVETEWVGRTLAIGDDVRLGVALPDPRCVMPSLAQEDLPRDPRILKALAKHNRIDVAGALYPCAGVYAVAEATGTIRKDDRVSLV